MDTVEVIQNKAHAHSFLPIEQQRFEVIRIAYLLVGDVVTLSGGYLLIDVVNESQRFSRAQHFGCCRVDDKCVLRGSLLLPELAESGQALLERELRDLLVVRLDELLPRAERRRAGLGARRALADLRELGLGRRGQARPRGVDEARARAERARFLDLGELPRLLGEDGEGREVLAGGENGRAAEHVERVVGFVRR